jgi:hypothetical protein
MDELAKTAAKITEQLAAVAGQHAEEATQLAGAVLQAAAWFYILMPVAFAVAGLVAFAVCRLFLYLEKKYGNEEWDTPLSVIPAVVSFMFGCVAVIAALVNWTNMVYWWAAFDYKFAIAASVLGKL